MTTDKINIKTAKDIKKMHEGGKKLAEIKRKLSETVKLGVSAIDVENLANKLIKKSGGEASFKMVPGYSWATCVNLNEGIVHGIPKKEIVFKKGDVISVDIGLFFKGFHTDTSFTLALEPSDEIIKFLEIGKLTLEKAIKKAKIGNKIYDISLEIEKFLESSKYVPIKALVGHGIGRDLHEAPQIPCFTSGSREESLDIGKGTVLAIEVMYTTGKPDISVAEDGWTISTRNGRISGLFEETVAVINDGPLVLTRIK